MAGGATALKLIAVAALLTLLAACSSTATQTTMVDSRTGTSQQISGSVRIGTIVDSRYLGRWTLSDRFAHSCTFQFLDAPMGTSSSIAKLERPGYCTAPFDEVAGWRSDGRSLVLFDETGNRLATLSNDGSDVFRGQYSSRRLSVEVMLRKGFV